MSDEIKKPVFKAPQIPMHAPAMPHAPEVGKTTLAAQTPVTGAKAQTSTAQPNPQPAQPAQPAPARSVPPSQPAPATKTVLSAQTTFEGKGQASNAGSNQANAALGVSAQSQTASQGASDEKGKNFVKDLNLPPRIMETKVMAAVVAGIVLFGMMMGCMMFGGEETRVVQGLTDVVINPDIQKNLWRCGQIDPNRECVLYIMNAKTYDRLGSDFFQEAQNITGVPKYSIQMINVRYANVLIRPGYIAQIYIPARK